MRVEYGWRSRGYLPHFEGGERAQFITFRLHDSLPQAVLDGWRRELTQADDALLRRRIETYLDRGYGCASLRAPEVAAMTQSALLYHDGSRYRLAAWVVMPNHVHLLAIPCAEHTLAAIMHALKSYTAHEANKLLRQRGPFWQEEYFDRYIRDADHYTKTITYIEHNPVKAGLCRTPTAWPYSSAHFRHST